MTIQFTPNYNLPYPQLPDSPDVPRDVEALAKAVDSQLASSLVLNVPIGSMMMWPAAAAPAGSGWVLCDGAAKKRSGVDPDGKDYSALFAIVSTVYGTGDGSTTFNLPDLKGRMPIGAGTGAGGESAGSGKITGGLPLTARALGGWSGREMHKLVITEMANHGHTPISTANLAHSHAITADPGHAHTIASGQWLFYNANAGQQVAFSQYASAVSFFRSAASTDAGGSHSHGGATGAMSANGTHSHTITAQGGDAKHENMVPFMVVNFIIKFK